jgi:hypothetical protein
MVALCALLLNLSVICLLRLSSCSVMSHHGKNANCSSVIWRDSTEYVCLLSGVQANWSSTLWKDGVLIGCCYGYYICVLPNVWKVMRQQCSIYDFCCVLTLK